MAAMKGVPHDQSRRWNLSPGRPPSRPYPSGAYRYTFTLDGVSATDRKNAASSESLSPPRFFACFLIPGNFTRCRKRRAARWNPIAVVYYEVEDARRELRRMHIYLPPGYEKGTEAYPVLLPPAWRRRL